ncbi:MAG: 50S ribosomal protein L29 [bacterium]|nr:50S ribosomal protein L29 [bacterium]
MKHQELKAWREKTNQEIEAELQTLSSKLTSAYLAKSANKLKNTAMIKNFKTEIARLKTILREREMESK